MFITQWKKKIRVDIRRKKRDDRYTATSWLYNININGLFVMRLTQNKNESIKSMLQYGNVVRKSCSVVSTAL